MGLYLLSRGPHCESPWTNGQITSGQWRLGSKGTPFLPQQELGLEAGDDFYRARSPLFYDRFHLLPDQLPESSATPPSARKADSPLHVSSPKFPSPSLHFPLPSPPLLEDTVYSGMGRVSRLDFLNFFFFHRFLSLLLLLLHSRWKNGFFLGEEKGTCREIKKIRL